MTKEVKIIRKYENYSDYIRHQSEKSLDSKRISKWLGEEWEQKIQTFDDIFNYNIEFIKSGGKGLAICARTGQEVVALKNIGVDAIGVDIVAHPPLVIEGDAHNLPFEDNTFDFVFSNSLDHSIDPRKFVSEAQRVVKSGGYILFHLQLLSEVDDYAENIIVSPDSVIDLFDSCIVVKSQRLVNQSYQWELVCLKNEH